MEFEQGSNRRFLFGIVLIVFGALWMLVKLHIIPDSFSHMIISWQSLLIVIGIVTLINGNQTTGWILILIGSVLPASSFLRCAMGTAQVILAYDAGGDRRGVAFALQQTFQSDR